MATGDKRFDAFMAKGRKMVEELTAELDALEAGVNGEKTPGQRANAMIAAWSARWQSKYRTGYVLAARAKAIAGFMRLFKASMTDEDIMGRMDAYLKSTDRFYSEARHSLDLFFTSVNKFSGTPVDDADFLQAPVINCSHTPRCKSDQEHTRKRAAEMRA